MTADAINGLFEFSGAVLTARNVIAVVRDRGYAGIRPATIAFFFGWGVWNIFYYPLLRQWWSFVGGLALVAANCAWVFTMAHYGGKV